MLIPNHTSASSVAWGTDARTGSARANRVTIHAVAPPGEARLLGRLHGAIGEGGGWVLHRVHLRQGTARMVFEFPRDVCVDLYGAMVSLGLELDQASHRVMADLCRRTPYLFDVSSRSMAVDDNSSLDRATAYICSLEFIKVELSVNFVAQTEIKQRGFCAENAA